MHWSHLAVFYIAIGHIFNSGQLRQRKILIKYNEAKIDFEFINKISGEKFHQKLKFL